MPRHGRARIRAPHDKVSAWGRPTSAVETAFMSPAPAGSTSEVCTRGRERHSPTLSLALAARSSAQDVSRGARGGLPRPVSGEAGPKPRNDPTEFVRSGRIQAVLRILVLYKLMRAHHRWRAICDARVSRRPGNHAPGHVVLLPPPAGGSLCWRGQARIVPGLAPTRPRPPDSPPTRPQVAPKSSPISGQTGSNARNRIWPVPGKVWPE